MNVIKVSLANAAITAILTRTQKSEEEATMGDQEKRGKERSTKRTQVPRDEEAAPTGGYMDNLWERVVISMCHIHSSRSTPCLYCPEWIRGEHVHLSHRQTEHRRLDFGCGGCGFSTPFLDQLLRHLAMAHSLPAATSESEKREAVSALAARGLARLPADLRALRCRLCPVERRREVPERQFLAQDRVRLRSHVERSHGGLRIGMGALRYECRVCKEEFPHTEAFLAHPCCELNGQNRYLL